MSFLNIGKKDEYGRQRRIEHRGRFLRASRTGGVALRAQAKVAGLTLSGNTSHGLRVSATPLRNTQVALQNGRFILRGRYGRGPTKLNLSKSGVTVSTRNALGTFNWVKPNRSSAKIAGIQWRGKTAANMQVAYMAVLAVVSLVQLVLLLSVRLVRILMALAGGISRLVAAMPAMVAEGHRRWRNGRLERQFPSFKSGAPWQPSDLQLALALVMTHWGRGRSVRRAPVMMGETAREIPDCSLLNSWPDRVEPMRWRVGRWEARAGKKRIGHLARMAWLGREAARHLDADQRVALAFALDDCARAQGARTRLQDQLLEVFCDFAGLLFELPDEPLSEEDPEQSPEPPSMDPPSRRRPLVDLNRASLEELESIPHIGPERAQEIIQMRPIRRLEELRAIDGIGPQRLAEIEAYGVML